MDEAGGAVAAVESGFVQEEIERAAFEFQRQVETGERVIVGVNAFEEEPGERIELLQIDPAAERRQLERTAQVRAERNAEEAAAAIAAVREAAQGDSNLLLPMREALRARCTVGEICESLREEWGMYDAVRADAQPRPSAWFVATDTALPWKSECESALTRLTMLEPEVRRGEPSNQLHWLKPSGDERSVAAERHDEDPALAEDALRRERLAAHGEVAERVGDQGVVEELEPAQDVRAGGEDEIRARGHERVCKPSFVAAVLSEVVLGAVGDVLVVRALGACVEDGDDEVGTRGGLPHEPLRRGNVGQALSPRVRREAENRNSNAASTQNGDLLRSAAPAQPVAGKRTQGLPLSGGAVVERVIVRDVQVVEARTAQEGGRLRWRLEREAAGASGRHTSTIHPSSASLRGSRSRCPPGGAVPGHLRTPRPVVARAERCHRRRRSSRESASPTGQRRRG